MDKLRRALQSIAKKQKEYDRKVRTLEEEIRKYQDALEHPPEDNSQELQQQLVRMLKPCGH